MQLTGCLGAEVLAIEALGRPAIELCSFVLPVLLTLQHLTKRFLVGPSFCALLSHPYMKGSQRDETVVFIQTIWCVVDFDASFGRWYVLGWSGFSP